MENDLKEKLNGIKQDYKKYSEVITSLSFFVVMIAGFQGVNMLLKYQSDLGLEYEKEEKIIERKEEFAKKRLEQKVNALLEENPEPPKYTLELRAKICQPYTLIINSEN